MADYLLKNLKNIQFAGRHDRKLILQADPYARTPDYQLFDEIQLKKRGISPLLVICGVENYRAIQTFQSDLKRHTAVLAEPDTARMRQLLTDKDLLSFIKNNNILFVVGKAARRLGDEIEAYFSVAAVDNILTVPPLDERKTEFDEALSNLGNFRRTARTNRATMEKFLFEWYCFFAENLSDYLLSPPLSELKDSLIGRDCCLVGPGADLDDRLNLLKEASNGWLIALDTALPILLKLDIEPDFVVCVDSGKSNLQHLENFPKTSTLITPPYMRPEAINYTEKVRFFEPNFPAAQWLKPEFPSPGFLAMSGSVSITALDFVGLLNPRSCLMLGIDLSYKNGLPFSRLSPLYDKLAENINRFQSLPTKITKQLQRYELKPVKQGNKKLISSSRFLSWANSLSFLIEQFPFPVYRPQSGILPLKKARPLTETKLEFKKDKSCKENVEVPVIDYQGLSEKLQKLESELAAQTGELNLIESLYSREKSIAHPWLSFARQLTGGKEIITYFQWEIDRLTGELQDVRPDNQEDIFLRQYERWNKLIETTRTGLNVAIEEIQKQKD
jgi:hypothetical protein